MSGMVWIKPILYSFNTEHIIQKWGEGNSTWVDTESTSQGAGGWIRRSNPGAPTCHLNLQYTLQYILHIYILHIHCNIYCT